MGGFSIEVGGLELRVFVLRKVWVSLGFQP